MKIKTAELVGAALDYAVDLAEGYGAVFLKRWNEGGDRRFTYCEVMRCYSKNWGVSGPIIEREQISLVPFDDTRWEARAHCTVQRSPALFIERRAPTPLIAAMRCFVASKLGDIVDIPEELK